MLCTAIFLKQLKTEILRCIFMRSKIKGSVYICIIRPTLLIVFFGANSGFLVRKILRPREGRKNPE